MELRGKNDVTKMRPERFEIIIVCRHRRCKGPPVLLLLTQQPHIYVSILRRPASQLVFGFVWSVRERTCMHALSPFHFLFPHLLPPVLL